ncbi:MAG: Loki-CTERM sorting domain-containing protein [Promethearchaeota archaeon]
MISKMKTIPIVALALALTVVLAPMTTTALPPETYVPGSEAAIFDHTFAEHFWSSTKTFTNETSGDSIEIIMHSVNYQGAGEFQAALLALGDVYIAENDTSATLPYQIFGMHFTTPEGHEMFTGAIFAFMFAFNDTNGNNVHNPGEDQWFVIPYGYDNPESNHTGTDPTVESIDMTNPNPGEYRFGVSYKNLYARLVSTENWLAFWLTLAVPFVEVQISELTFEYVINVDESTGEITAETFYTIGQVQSLHFLGQTLDVPDQEIHNALANVTVGVAHLITAWGSTYHVHNGNQLDPQPAANWIYANITTDALGRDRAFAVGVRGTYDLQNETTEPYPTLNASLPAYSWILSPALFSLETLLVLWQLPLSADFLALWAYAISPTMQSMYTGPRALYQHAYENFNKIAFWYAITFPKFGGYRIVHDPVYTAYSNVGQVAPPGIPGFPWEAILIGVVVCVVAVFLVRRRKKA